MVVSYIGPNSPHSPLGRLTIGMASQLSWRRTGRITPTKEDFELAGVIWDFLTEAGVSLKSLAEVALGLGEVQSHWYLTGVLLVEKCVFGVNVAPHIMALNERGIDFPDVDASAFASGFRSIEPEPEDNPLA